MAAFFILAAPYAIDAFQAQLTKPQLNTLDLRRCDGSLKCHEREMLPGGNFQH